jgi:hypothetical protein
MVVHNEKGTIGLKKWTKEPAASDFTQPDLTVHFYQHVPLTCELKKWLKIRDGTSDSN